MNEWIRDPAAIATVIAIKELREGDEILMKSPQGAGFPAELAGAVVVIMPVEDESALGSAYPDSGKYPTVAEIIEGTYRGWVLTTNQLAAWRRS